MSKFTSLLAGKGMKKAVAGFFAAVTVISFSVTAIHAENTPLPTTPVGHAIWGEDEGASYVASASRAIWGEEELNDFFGPADHAIWGEGSLAHAIWGEDLVGVLPIADPVFGYPISMHGQILWSDGLCDTDGDGDCDVDCDEGGACDGEGTCTCGSTSAP